MNTEKEIYTTNKWQEILLASCCEDFGITLSKRNIEGKKTNWILAGHPVNLNGTLSGYFSNLKLGQPVGLTSEEIDEEHKRRFPDRKEFKEMPASFYNEIRIDRAKWDEDNSFVPPANLKDFIVFQTKVPSVEDQLLIEIAFRTTFIKSSSNEIRDNLSRTRTYYFHNEDIPTLTAALRSEDTELSKLWIGKLEDLEHKRVEALYQEQIKEIAALAKERGFNIDTQFNELIGAWGKVAFDREQWIQKNKESVIKHIKSTLNQSGVGHRLKM